MSFSIELIGNVELAARLDPARLESVISQALPGMGADVQRMAQVYPPELPNQRYRRTFALRGSWRQRRAGPTELHVESAGVVYAPWVQGAPTQARIHRGRWQTDEGIARAYEPTAQRQIERAIQAALG